MKGLILDYNTQEEGVISGDDGQRYQFTSNDLKGDTNPTVGSKVDFDVEGSLAKNIYPLASPHIEDNTLGQKNALFIGYALLGVGLFTGLFWLLGGIWAFIKRGEASEHLAQTHYANMTSVFVWGTGLSILGFLTIFFVIGWFILVGTWFWVAYRIFTGISKLSANEPAKV